MSEKRRLMGPREVGATVLLALRRNKSTKKMLLAVLSRGGEGALGSGEPMNSKICEDRGPFMQNFHY